MNSASAPLSPPHSGSRRRSGVVVPHPPRWHQRLAAVALYSLLRLITATLRWRLVDQAGFVGGGERGIFCIWHNRLATCMRAYWGFVAPRSGTPGMAALVSASRDGGFLTGILECFRVQPVRGSSSRRGAQAVLELSSWAERGYDLAITPDGPRGPRYVVQEGAVALAQVTCLPILPVVINVNWKLQVRSWDRFQIPLPFSRCEVILGAPVRVPREATDADREVCRRQVQATMLANTRD